MADVRGRAVWLLPLLLVSLAAALRFWGIDQGLPFPNARPDEREALAHTVNFPAGDLNPRWFVYPNLFFWVIWAWEELALALRRLIVPTASYSELLAHGLPALLFNGRLLTAAVGTATVPLVYRVGQRVGGRALGAIAALIVATNLLHVRDSHALKADVFLTFGVVACLDLLARWVTEQTEHTWRRAALAGLAIGVTTALKYPGILLLGTAYHADVLASRVHGVRRLLPSGGAILLAVIALGTFIAGSPYLLLDFEHARPSAVISVQAVYAPRPDRRAPPNPGLVERVRRSIAARAFGYHLGVSLRHGCGLALALLAPAALIAGCVRPRHPFFPLCVSFALLYFLAVGVSPVRQSRYLTPLVPLLAFLVADLLLRVTARVARPQLRAALVAGLALAVVAEPALSSVRYDRIIARTDTRVLATRWMAEHLPPGAVVAQLGTLVFPIADPELPPSAVRAPLTLGETDLGRHHVTHVVTHEHQLPFSVLIASQMRAIQPHLRLLAEFSPYTGAPAGSYEPEDAYYVPLYDFAGVERGGPLVRIYAYEPSA
jgi:4-amino-4-deoxy-L-arabinose transferase-like glycosyltransferase